MIRRRGHSDRAVLYKNISLDDYEKEFTNTSSQTDPILDVYSDESLDCLAGDEERMSRRTKEIWDKISEKRRERETEMMRIGTSLKELKYRTGWKTIRIFVSSTFNDFQSEREALVKKVFPDLKEWCQQRQLHLVECDLTWGAPGETSNNVEISTRMEEIDRCIQDNVLPFFLNMTCERVGWIPQKQQGDMSDDFIQRYNWVLGFSVTEMEIVHAAFGNKNPNALFLIRDESFLESVPEAHKKKFKDHDLEKLAPCKVRVLKEQIKAQFPKEQVHVYQVEYSREDKFGYPVLNVGKDFCKKVLGFFKSRIKQQYPKPGKESDSDEKDRKFHENFFRSRAEFVIGRNDILKRVEEYVSMVGKERATPLVLVGSPGMGKSSLMAAAVQRTIQKMTKKTGSSRDEKSYVFYHFTGAVPDSTDLFQMLCRLLIESQAVDNRNKPSDLDTACQETYSVLSNANRTKQIIIFVDAVNQFAGDEEAIKRLTWLPRKLSKCARCIISTVTNSVQHSCFPQLSENLNEIRLMPLTLRDKKDITKAYMKRYGKTIDVDLFVDLVEKKSSGNPLWLTLASEEMRIFGLFHHLSDKTEHLKDGLQELGLHIVKRLVSETGPTEGALLMAALCLIQVTPGGLYENELKMILADKQFLELACAPDVKGKRSAFKGGKLYDSQWAVIYRGLRAFIRPIGDSGEGLLGFYHQSLSEAVHRAYFNRNGENDVEKSPSRYDFWYKKLVSFFGNSNSLKRRVEVLPHCFIQLDDMESLKSFLLDWDIFDILFNKEYSAKLVRYWQKCCDVDETLNCYKTMLDGFPNNRDRAFRHFQVAYFLQQAGADPKKTRELAERADISSSGNSSTEDIRHDADVHSLQADLYYQEVQDSGYLDEHHEEPLRRCVQLHEYVIDKPVDLDKKFTAIQKMKLGTRQGALASVVEADEKREEEAGALFKDARQNVEAAREMFKEENDKSRQAEACMSLATLYDGKEKKQLDLYKKALKLCTQANGDIHTLTYRIHLNTAICYQRAGKWDSSYDEYKEAYNIAVTLFGESHKRTKSAMSHLKEDHNQRIARQRNDTDILASSDDE